MIKTLCSQLKIIDFESPLCRLCIYNESGTLFLQLNQNLKTDCYMIYVVCLFSSGQQILNTEEI